MKNWKRLICLLLSGAMALSLAACGAAGPSASASPSDGASPSPSGEIVADLSVPPLEFAAGLDPEDTLLTINGEAVSADLALYWLNYTCYHFLLQYGVYGANLADYADQLWEDAVSFSANEVLLRQRAAQLGCLPTDAQTQQAREEMEAEPDTLELFRNYYGLTDASIEYLFLSEAYYENMLAAVTHEPSQEELADYLAENGVYRVKHILLKTVDDDNQPLPDDEIAQKKAQAEDLLAQLQSAQDLPALFDELMNQYSEDGRTDDGALAAPDGYLAEPGRMVAEFEEAGQSLEPGQLSDIVETTYGYHILLGLDLAPFTSEETALYQDSYRPAALLDLAAQWQEEAEIIPAEALTQLDVAAFYNRMNAYQQALEERDAAQESAGPESAPVESGGVG